MRCSLFRGRLCFSAVTCSDTKLGLRCDNRIVTRVECLFSAMHTHTNNCQEMSCDGVIIKEEHRPLCDTKFLNRPVSNALASKAINRLLA